MKAAAPFWSAPASAPPFDRVESSLMLAFEGFPKLVVPPVTAQHGKRVFQLRTYESPTIQDHIIKVDMFHHGEFDIFQKAGFWNVFFGDTLIGPRLPQLIYMVSFPDISEVDVKWDAFLGHPDWKKLAALPKYSSEAIVGRYFQSHPPASPLFPDLGMKGLARQLEFKDHTTLDGCPMFAPAYVGRKRIIRMLSLKA